MAKLDLRKSIKRQMKKQELNVPALARAIDVNQMSLYNYLAGRSELTAANMEKLLAALGAKVVFP